MSSNPLFEPSKLQFQAPVFDQIKPEHYAPAFEAGMEEQLKEITAIKASKEAATFGNTVEALERSGRLLTRAATVFHNLNMANTNSELQKLEEEYAPRFAQHQDSIYLDSDLYARVKAVYDARESLSGEERRLVEFYEKEFSVSGANLDDAQKTQLKQINSRLASLEAEFSKRLLATSQCSALVLDSPEALDGLTEDQIEAARLEAETIHKPGKYAIPIFNTTQQPLFAELKNRHTRRKLFEASLTRAERDDANDTRAAVQAIVRLRLKKAQILGCACFADWKLQRQMATTETAQQLLRDLIAPSVAAVDAETKEMQALAKAQGHDFDLAPWDWVHFSEQLRKEKHSLEESELMPYFELNSVLENGVFYAANQLYGITMKRRTDLPVYDADTRVYEVFDHDGSSMALFYFDPYGRTNKKGGAWCTSYVKQSRFLKQKPVVFNVCNFTAPAPGKPCLLTQDHLRTLFHEFGHGLHALLSDCEYASISGTSVPRDFVELPSQVNEHWAWHDPVLKHYAIHHQTKEVIPDALVAKLKAAATFAGGFTTLENAAASIVDMCWHTVNDEKDFLDIHAMENRALTAFGVPDKYIIPPRYLSSYHAHSFQWGYSAGYYSYLWAKLLDCDGFEWFLEKGGMTRQNGDHFRQTVLSKGSTVDLNEAYINFTGRKPTVEPFLKSRGLIPS